MMNYLLILFAVNFVLSVSHQDISINRNESERVLRLTMRTFSNSPGNWITQVHMEREGFTDAGEIPRVKFSVEQNKSEFSRPPRLIAHVAEALYTDEEIVEMDDGSYFLNIHPRLNYWSARLFCRRKNAFLAVPSDAANEWTQKSLRGVNLEYNLNGVQGVYVGIYNYLNPEGSFETEWKQPVLNGTEVLQNSEGVMCGVWNVFDSPPTLNFDHCGSRHPYLCERRPNRTIPKNFDASPWLMQNN